MKKYYKLLVLIVSLIICVQLMGNVSYAAGKNIEEVDHTQIRTKLYPEYEGEIETIQFSLKSGKVREFNSGLAVNEASASMRYALPNYVTIAIIPQSSSYKITITNIGVDIIDKISLKARVYKNSGPLLTSGSKLFKNVKPGNTTWTWKVKKGDTVQEKMNVSGTAKDGKSYISFKGSTVRYNFAGGRYGTMKAYDGQKHHMPSKNVSPLSAYNGPAVRMIASEHKKTASYGSSTAAKRFRDKEKKKIDKGEFLGAQALGIADLRNKFGSKYNAAINSMITYTKSLGYTR